MTVLSKNDIQLLLKQEPPLIEHFIDLELQLQPNGIDLTLREITILQTPGTITTENHQRILSGLTPLTFDGMNFIHLAPGIYLVTYNEIIHLTTGIMALAQPRSSLLRCGVTVHTAVWDSGYSGRSQSLLVVYNPQGFRVQRNARIIQLVFLKLTQNTESYNGSYQGENI